MKVGDRVSYSGSICTIRYIGELPAWPGVVAYGVEWDDATRGKHSGDLNGVQYFETIIPGAGSFIKSTRPCDRMRSFKEALTEKYAPEIDETPVIQLSRSKVIQNVGFDKVRRYQEQFHRLPIVSLANFGIVDTGNGPLELTSLRSLDLSSNLFTDIKSVYELCKHFSGLETLTLNSNRLCYVSDGGQLPQVKELSLSGTLITGGNIKLLPQTFPNIEVLTLAKNKLTNASEIDVSQFKNLKTLDISFNDLTDLPPSAGNVDNINISHNKVAKISSLLSGTLCVDISHNSIECWDVIDSLPCLVPKLETLRINDNPFLAEIAANQDALILGRCSSAITKLNGISITERERTDAELFYMGKVASQAFAAPPTKRWNELCVKHGERTVAPASAKKDTLNSKMLSINVKYNNEERQIKILRNCSVQKLKTTVARQFKLSALSIHLQTESGIDLAEPLRSVEFYNIQQDDCILAS